MSSPGSLSRVAAARDTPVLHGDRLIRTVMAELTGSLNTQRTVLRLLHLVTEAGLADWAMLALVDSRREGYRLCGGSVHDFTASVPRSMLDRGTVDQVLQSGQAEILHVSVDDDGRSVADVVPHPRLAGELTELRPVDVLVVPLSGRGVLVGAMVLARADGHGFGERDLRTAVAVAERAAVALDSAALYEERAQVGAILETTLRPGQLPDLGPLNLAARWRPAAEHLELGGDFYDVYGDRDDSLLILGDVCGKGVEAAVLNGRARQTVRTAALFDLSPATVLAALNDALFEPFSVTFVTAVAARLRREGDGFRATIAVAGHEAPLVVRADGTVVEVAVAGPLAGVFPKAEPYVESEVQLAPGDVLVLFSDGVTEARDRDGEVYGGERLRRLASAYAGLGSGTLIEALERAVIDHVAGRGHDDITMLAAWVHP